MSTTHAARAAMHARYTGTQDWHAPECACERCDVLRLLAELERVEGDLARVRDYVNEKPLEDRAHA